VGATMTRPPADPRIAEGLRAVAEEEWDVAMARIRGARRAVLMVSDRGREPSLIVLPDDYTAFLVGRYDLVTAGRNATPDNKE
jgi:hypothetical protein